MMEDPQEGKPGASAGSDVNSWPPGRVPSEGERIELRCEECDALWYIHVSMAGHRLRCKCDAWLEIPRPETSLEQLAPHQEKALDRFKPTRELSLDKPPSSFEHVPDVDVHTPLKPGALRYGLVRTRQRWINRATVELALVVAAFLAPSLFLHLFVGGRERLLFMPLGELYSGFAVVLVGLFASHYTFEGLRRAMPKYFMEAAIIGIGLAALAIPYSRLVEQVFPGAENPLKTLRETLGLTWTLLLIGAFPAVFEEIAFRGLLQGRLSVIYGRTGGILLSGVAFALAHGAGLGLPFHVTGGFYLGWLRARSKSLLPCMVTHLLYNSTLVLTLT